MTNLYVEISSASLRAAEEFTARELDGGCVVPHSKRIVTKAEQERAAFWRMVEQRQKDRRPVLRRVV